jgi:hypothetical protein
VFRYPYSIVLLISILLSISGFVGNGQTSFVYSYTTNSDELPFDAVKTTDGCFIVAAKIGTYSPTHYNTLLIKLNAVGDTIVTKTIFKNEGTCMVGDLLESSDGNYFCIGIQIETNETKLWLLKMNQNLDVLLDTTYSIGMKNIVYFFGLLDSYNNLIVYGNANTNFTDDHPYILKLTQWGDSLSYRYYADSGSEFVFSLIEKPDTTGYYMMIYGKYQVMMNTAGQILTFDYNLNVTAIDSIPRFLTSYYNAKFVDDKQFVLTGKKATSFTPRTDKLGILKLDTSFNVVNEYYLGPDDTISYPGYLHNLDFIDTNNIYYGGTCNQAIADFSSNKSYYMLGNFDSSLNLKWQKYYGGDMYYTLWGLIATSDGGCLLLGSSYDHLTQDMERDIYIIKVDSTGVITSTDETRHATMHDAIVYPNPGKDYLMIESGPQVTGAAMVITDIYGRQVLNETINESLIHINTHSLNKGTYLWQIILRNKVIETGIWIKY